MADEVKQPEPKHEIGQTRLYLGEKHFITDREWEPNEGFWQYRLKGRSGWIPENLLSKPEVQDEARSGLIKDFPGLSAVETPEVSDAPASNADKPSVEMPEYSGQSFVPPAQSSPTQRKNRP